MEKLTCVVEAVGDTETISATGVSVTVTSVSDEIVSIAALDSDETETVSVYWGGTGLVESSISAAASSLMTSTESELPDPEHPYRSSANVKNSRVKRMVLCMRYLYVRGFIESRSLTGQVWKRSQQMGVNMA